MISPVTAVSARQGLSRKSEARASVVATPADGPSFGTAPAGKWTWERKTDVGYSCQNAFLVLSMIIYTTKTKTVVLVRRCKEKPKNSLTLEAGN